MDATTDQMSNRMCAEAIHQKSIEPVMVNYDLANYLTLTPDQGKYDLEEREWSLQATAEQLKRILAERGIHWQIPLIEHRVRLVSGKSESSTIKQLTLMLRLHQSVSWADYENAVKASLKLRRDFWVIRTCFETIKRSSCLSLQLKGSHDQIEEQIRLMQQFAENQHYNTTGEYYIIYHNDEERVPEKDLLTTLLIPIRS